MEESETQPSSTRNYSSQLNHKRYNYIYNRVWERRSSLEKRWRRAIRKRSSDDQLRKLKTSKLVRIGTSNNKHSVSARPILIFLSRRDVSELRLLLTGAKYIWAMKENECIFLAHCRLACRSVNLHTWRDQTASCFNSAQSHLHTVYVVLEWKILFENNFFSSSIKLNSCGLGDECQQKWR